MRQKYLDKTRDNIIVPNYDLFQIKYDGIWASINVRGTKADVYSRTGKHKLTLSVPPQLTTYTLIGEYMFGSQRAQTSPLKDRLCIFDIITYNDSDLKPMPYHKRYELASVLLRGLNITFYMVPNYSVSSFDLAWEKCEDVEEGFVFRHSDSTYDEPLTRLKYGVEGLFYAVDFHLGMGRHTGRLGAISVAEGPNGPAVMKVGGGFTDAQRDDIWNNLDYYRNRPMEIVGKGKFESGAFRHPNFKRWLPLNQ
jgi:ATP-dependent DNA ligase